MASDATKQRRQPPSAAPPRTLDVRKYADSRATELESLHSIVSNRLNNDFRSQRNKRRRTTGFDSKRRRKPRNSGNAVKDFEKEENEKKLPRRVRRRIELTKKNPEVGFSASGDGTKRLRTHVWHAKRFTMDKFWGFYLPVGLHGSGKGSRALLKWYKQGAVVHDASYYSAVQLEGSEEALSSILSMLLVPSMIDHSEDICQRFLSGDIYGCAMLHHARQDGFDAICPVTFMWRPLHQHSNVAKKDKEADENMETESSFQLRQLWIWMHPSAFREGLDCLKLACQKMTNETGNMIGCVPLDGQLAKLEVMGSRAFRLLQKILHPISLSVEDSFELNTGLATAYTNGCEIQPRNYLENEDCFSSGAAVLLTVIDPRSSCHKKSLAAPAANLANEQFGSMEDKSEENYVGNLPMKEDVFSTLQSKYDSNASLSNCKDLWDASNGIHPPVEEHKLCLEKHQKSLDFFRLKDTSSTKFASADGHFSRFCPILLLRNANEADHFTGWSIILPISWVKAFWIPLVSGGAHAIGLREKHWIACDVGLPCFPSDFPDCNAYSRSTEIKASAVDKTLEKCPPATRPFEIPIQLPWNSKWFSSSRGAGEGNGMDCSSNVTRSADPVGKLSDNLLVSDGGYSKVLVARTSRMLISIMKELSSDNLLLFPKGQDRPTLSHLMMKEAKISASNLATLTCDRRLCFLRVVLHAFKEGVFDEGAVVCAPCLSDITLLKSRPEGNEGLQVPHAFVGSYFKKLPSGKWDFQMPMDPAAREAYRPPIGFVTSGFVRGSKKPGAVAFCEAVLLAHLRYEQWSWVPAKKRRKEIFVLVRNLRSTAYRLALATIVLERQEEDVESL
ncbi:uncharacterized protein LOC110733017 [Chenopodium quinoa]|uniref:Uncharacterized protein n=1 Tax=Chenopodium quinoa TaxID=63459 RepID=A0A803M7F9_CHEQI|nr:uncharacterized protein LOC110733017 [Chenopodium quinoa]